ncbi:sushi, von Willebrand factor type A, EGF and pentraxin domain-containing protein 1-like [Haliotis rufescens]|uniref:sushi, von Willebrand factor type A, EGF and pentraxin domain-containing protein 1-like n=1 Tax=Haliotis rufescens TaxID=6454 RepID=UPI00201F0E62|nr:sushi, von Willebrand factor type A, EGF and pentraxin domain-containing protein 1-like [Haliotis rufescens]
MRDTPNPTVTSSKQSQRKKDPCWNYPCSDVQMCVPVQAGDDYVCSGLEIDCGQPAEVASSKVSFAATSYGAIAHYTCLSGYTASPNTTNNTMCTSVGVWHNNTVSCAPVDCGLPPIRTNAMEEHPATTFGSGATYTCNVGYINTGTPATATCNENKAWVKAGNECQPVDCLDPAPIANADVSLTTAGLSLYQARAQHTCHVGYILMGGNGMITCLSTAQWSSGPEHCQYRCDADARYVSEGDCLIALEGIDTWNTFVERCKSLTFRGQTYRLLTIKTMAKYKDVQTFLATATGMLIYFCFIRLMTGDV